MAPEAQPCTLCSPPGGISAPKATGMLHWETGAKGMVANASCILPL